jgi:N-methylhydantoinase B/acetone carboxylase alpha subunit
VPNDKVNDGAYLATTSEFPVGTWTNPDDPFISTSRAWGFLNPGFTGMFRSLSRGFYGRGFLEEVVAGYPMTASSTSGGGVGDDGRETAYTSFELSCQGTGAGAARDGADHCAALWNPEGDMGEVESWEGVAPLVYLGRRVKPCTGGPGTWRGGMGFESLLMVNGRHTQYLQHSGDGYVFSAPGVFGGYPGNAGYIHDVHDVALNDDPVLRTQYPVNDGDPAEGSLDCLPRGRHRRAEAALMMPEAFERGDVYLSVQRGGPGLGDPLAREPARVAADVTAGRLSSRRAEAIYGVVVAAEAAGGWRVDAAGTGAAREAIRARRGRRARPVRDWYGDERRRILEERLSEPVAEMYRSSLSLSSRWGDEFMAFWDLPGDFEP